MFEFSIRDSCGHQSPVGELFCTRPKGHAGSHVGGGWSPRVYGLWDDDAMVDLDRGKWYLPVERVVWEEQDIPGPVQPD